MPIARPHTAQVSLSMLNTRYNRCAQLIEARRGADILSSGPAAAWPLAPLPRAPLVTNARCGVFGREHAVVAGEIHPRTSRAPIG